MADPKDAKRLIGDLRMDAERVTAPRRRSYPGLTSDWTLASKAADLLESQAARIAELEAALRKAEPYIYPIGDGMDVLDKVRRALASAEQRG